MLRACRAVRLSRAVYYRPPPARILQDDAVIDALQTVVRSRSRWGFWKCLDHLRWRGHRWNHKRVHRVYCALRLNLPRRTRRRRSRDTVHPLDAPATLNHTWAVDFMTDTLYDGRRFRTLNVLEEGSREGLTIDIGMSLPSVRVIAVLEDLCPARRAPGAARGQRTGAHGDLPHALVRPAPHRAALHPARQTPTERLHRTV